MPCYTPLHAYKGRKKENGKISIAFKRTDSFRGERLELACGQCIGCRLEYSRQWAIRCVHETTQHEDNCFITLTYDEKNKPKDGNLQLRDFQLFMKRLRKYEKPKKIRFYHCGEYGEENNRPHYHSIIFGHDFQDKTLFTQKGGYKLYTSTTLDKIWENKGYATIGEANFETAAYVARYMLKKQKGETAKEQIRINEYATMSRRPGIGHSWINENLLDVYSRDKVTINGKQSIPPKYYDGVLSKINENMLANIKKKRENNERFLHAYHKGPNGNMVICSDSSDYRLGIKEKVKIASQKLFGRREV